MHADLDRDLKSSGKSAKSTRLKTNNAQSAKNKREQMCYTFYALNNSDFFFILKCHNCTMGEWTIEVRAKLSVGTKRNF